MGPAFENQEPRQESGAKQRGVFCKLRTARKQLLS